MYYIKSNKGYITLDKNNKTTVCCNYRKAKSFITNDKAEKFLKSVNNIFINDLHVVIIEDKKKKDKVKLNNFNNTNLYSKYGYKTIYNHPQMGLSNIICENPIAFCKNKNVWLNEQQILKCLNKKDCYGYENKQCYYLIKNK